MGYSLAWLKDQLEQGSYFEYLFFWGHAQRREGIVDKSCFSQWYVSPFEVNNIIYRTAEHWMMAQKAILFNNDETLQKILAAEKPAIAKDLGRQVQNFDAAIWSSNAFSIVVEGNLHKFSQHETLKTLLLSTKDKVIVEASPSDTIWGIGLSQESSSASNPFEWRGTNLLGFALMEVRNRLR